MSQQKSTTTTPLTAAQKAIMRVLQTYINEKGYAPAIRDVGKIVGIRSANGVMCHFNALEKKGWIKRDPKVARSLTILRRVEDDPESTGRSEPAPKAKRRVAAK